ncbi:transcription elongation regulator 1-like protein [Cricetulus griseus]|nr:transcription elongation regulator 1-like protein [Cricetulus griseus]
MLLDKEGCWSQNQAEGKDMSKGATELGYAVGQGDYQNEMLSSHPPPDFVKLNTCTNSPERDSNLVKLARWLFGGHSPSIGLSPSSAVELVPLFPHVCPSALPPPVGKSWIDKRIPNYKEYGYTDPVPSQSLFLYKLVFLPIIAASELK